MKNILLTFFITAICFSCISDDGIPKYETQIVGKWRMIEQLIDPGDGSGTFQPIISDRTFEFLSNGTVKLNGNMCFIGNTVNPESFGTYEFIDDPRADVQFEGTIYPDDCEFSEATISFNLTLDGRLVIWYFCIEGCAEKYEKIN